MSLTQVHTRDIVVVKQGEGDWTFKHTHDWIDYHGSLSSKNEIGFLGQLLVSKPELFEMAITNKDYKLVVVGEDVMMAVEIKSVFETITIRLKRDEMTGDAEVRQLKGRVGELENEVRELVGEVRQLKGRVGGAVESLEKERLIGVERLNRRLELFDSQVSGLTWSNDQWNEQAVNQKQTENELWRLNGREDELENEMVEFKKTMTELLINQKRNERVANYLWARLTPAELIQFSILNR